LRDGRAEEALRVALELAEDVGGDLGRREAQLAKLDARDLIRLRGRFYVVGDAKREELELVLDLDQAAPMRRLTE